MTTKIYFADGVAASQPQEGPFRDTQPESCMLCQYQHAWKEIKYFMVVLLINISTMCKKRPGGNPQLTINISVMCRKRPGGKLKVVYAWVNGLKDVLLLWANEHLWHMCVAPLVLERTSWKLFFMAKSYLTVCSPTRHWKPHQDRVQRESWACPAQNQHPRIHWRHQPRLNVSSSGWLPFTLCALSIHHKWTWSERHIPFVSKHP